MCLEFATFDWPNFRLRAGIRRRPNLYFLNELENERAFGRLPNGFKKPFLAGEPLAFERTTEDLVFWKSENAAALGRISSPRIRRILNFPQPDLWGVGEISLVRLARLPGLSHPAQESLQNLGHARQESPYVFGLNQVRLHRMILLWTPDYNRTSGSSALDFFAGFWSAANTIRGQADF